MKMEQAKPQKTLEEKKAEVNAGCGSTIVGLAIVGCAAYSLYLIGQVQGWW